MKILILIAALFIFPFSVFGQSPRGKLPPNKLGVPSKLVKAQIQVESSGDNYAIGDKNLKNKANGCLQIRQPLVDDVNRVYGTHFRACDCLGDRELSVKIHGMYMDIYATKKQLGRSPKDEDRARIWNGGPVGWKKSSTKGYWKKVKKEMSVGDASRLKGR